MVADMTTAPFFLPVQRTCYPKIMLVTTKTFPLERKIYAQPGGPCLRRSWSI